MEYLGHLQFLHQNSMNSSHAHVKLLCQVPHRQSSVFLQGVVHWRNQTLIYFRFPAPAFFFLQRCSAVFEPFEPLKHQRTANSWSSRCTFHQFVGLSGCFPDLMTAQASVLSLDAILRYALGSFKLCLLPSQTLKWRQNYAWLSPNVTLRCPKISSWL